MSARGFDNDRYLLFEMTDEERAAYEADYEPLFRKFKAQTDTEHEEVVSLGGLYVLGTERHESRRIDNQLRGRSGRQGDPGESLFYLSLEDDLMRMFASDRVASIMERLKWPDGEPIEAKMVSRAVENAQKQIEELNFERRKNVLKYDEVMNGQREVIYAERRKILEGEDLKDQCVGFVQDVVRDVVTTWAPPDQFSEEWDRDQLITALAELFPVASRPDDLAEVDDVVELEERFVDEALKAYEDKEASVGPDVMREMERVVLLNITDTKWREHLYEMDYLQDGIHLRAYAQRDPLTEFRREAFDMFEELTGSIREDFVKYIYRVELVRHDDEQPRAPRVQRVQENREEVAAPVGAGSGSGAGSGGGGSSGGGGTAPMGSRAGGAAPQAISDKVPRNAPCPCGSGKKYKKCHGAVA
jgi:preprotein translocase subunit SecA